MAYEVESWHEGLNLGRLEGFRLIVAAMGGQVERVELMPPDQPDTDLHWHMRIRLSIDPDRAERCEQIAKRQFDGSTAMHRAPASGEGE